MCVCVYLGSESLFKPVLLKTEENFLSRIFNPDIRKIIK